MAYLFAKNLISLLNQKVLARAKTVHHALKWVCPLSSYKSGKRTCSCPEPCTPSKSGRMFYTYPDNLRSFPGYLPETLKNS